MASGDNSSFVTHTHARLKEALNKKPFPNVNQIITDLPAFLESYEYVFKENVRLHGEVNKMRKDQDQIGATVALDEPVSYMYGEPVYARKSPSEIDGVINRHLAYWYPLRTPCLDLFAVDKPLTFPNPANELQRQLNIDGPFGGGTRSWPMSFLIQVYFKVRPKATYGIPSALRIRNEIKRLLEERLPEEKPDPVEKGLGYSSVLFAAKHRHMTVGQILNKDPDYLVWMHENGHITLKTSIYREAQQRSRR